MTILVALFHIIRGMTWHSETGRKYSCHKMIAHQLYPPHFVSISGGIIIFLTKFRYLYCHNSFISTDSWSNPGNMWALMIANNAPCKQILTYLYAINIIYGLIISMIQGNQQNLQYSVKWDLAVFVVIFRMIRPEVTFDLGGDEFLKGNIFDIIDLCNRDPGICITASKKRNGNGWSGIFTSLTTVTFTINFITIKFRLYIELCLVFSHTFPTSL